MATAWAGSAWWKSHGERSPEDAVAYDHCLAANDGNTVACDAFLRMVERGRAKGVFLKTEGAKLLAAGFRKREVVQWASEMGSVSSQLSDAAGISLRELQTDKY